MFTAAVVLEVKVIAASPLELVFAVLELNVPVVVLLKAWRFYGQNLSCQSYCHIFLRQVKISDKKKEPVGLVNENLFE